MNIYCHFKVFFDLKKVIQNTNIVKTDHNCQFVLGHAQREHEGLQPQREAGEHDGADHLLHGGGARSGQYHQLHGPRGRLIPHV